MADALSDDDDAADRIAELNELRAAGAGGRKRSASKKAVQRAQGSKRVKAYTIPIPIEYKKQGDVYQKYKPGDTIRVYNRRTFDYAEENKVGEPVSNVPLPPVLFDDKYLFQNDGA